MKKLTSLFILAAAIFMVAAGCGSGDSGGATADAQPVSKETQDAVKDKGAADKPQVQAPDVKLDPGK